MELMCLMRIYNEVIEREKKAEIFFIDPDIPITVKEKWLPEFNKITIKLSKLMHEYKIITGKDMSTEEVLNGFNIE